MNETDMILIYFMRSNLSQLNLDGDILANKNRKVPGLLFLLSNLTPKIQTLPFIFPHCR